MIAANCKKRMREWNSYQAGGQITNPSEQSVTADREEIKREGRCADRVLRLVVDLLAGVFCLWVALTILGVIGLNNIGQQVISSLSLKIVVSSGLALIVCIVSSPLFVPWFLVFAPAYFLIPKESFLWKWWMCTGFGFLIGVAALWIDALLYSILAYGPSISINVPLVMAGSIPAGVLGAAICFAAAVTENATNRKNERSVR
jgi:hypothetical protein